jgi:hypothetical protein
MPSGITLAAGVLIGSPTALDAKFGPYNSTTDALNDIGVGLRYRGLTVGVFVGGVLNEYWFQEGTANENFVVKGRGSYQPDPETLPDEQSGVTVVAALGVLGDTAAGLLLPRIGDGSYGTGDPYVGVGRTLIERLLPSQAGGVSNRWRFWQYACSSEDCVDYFVYESTNSAVYPWLATWPAGASLIKGQLPRVGWANLSPTRNEGTSSYAARADHSHPFPTVQQVGAAPATHSHADATTSTAGFLSAAGKAKLDNSLDPSLFNNTQTQLSNWTTPVPINNTGKLLYSVLPRLLRSGATFSPSGIKNGYLEWRTDFFPWTRQEIFFAPSSPSLTWTDASPPAGTPSFGSRPSGDVWSLIPSNPTSELLYGVPLRSYVPYDNIGTSPSGQPTGSNPSLRGGIVPVSGTTETRRVRQFVITDQRATLAYVIDYPQTGDAASGPEQLELWYANSRNTVNGAFAPFTSDSILYRRIAVLGPTTDFKFAASVDSLNTPSVRVVQNNEDSETGAFVSRSVVATANVYNVPATAVIGPFMYPVWNIGALGITKSTEMGVLEFPASAGLVLSSVEPTYQNDWRALEWKAAASHTHLASAISDSTTAGRALLTAASAQAQRTALETFVSAANLTAIQALTGNFQRVYIAQDTRKIYAWSGTGSVYTEISPFPSVELVIACSDETSNLTVGANKVTFRAPYAFTLTGVRASVNTAPTGSALVVDINETGTSVLSTKLSIDANEKTSLTAASAAVISDSAIADDAEITIDIDQGVAGQMGKGLKIVLIGTRV